MEKLFGWRQWGAKASQALDEALESYQGFMAMVDRLGADMTPEEVTSSTEALHKGGRIAARKLSQMMGLEKGEEVKGPTGWRWSLMKGIIKETGDPDVDLPDWFRGHTPLGVTEKINSRGIFPVSGTTKAQQESAKHLQERGEDFSVSKNYVSYEENREESGKEMERLIKENHLEVVGSWEEVKSRWPDAMATRIATLVKAREDGSKKVRFIVDMRRSGVNALSTAGERIVLPRGSDLVRDLMDLMEHHDQNVEIMTADFSDAFLNLGIAEAERGHAVVLVKPGIYAAYRGVPFGLASAPLLWGRAAAFIGRATQAIHGPNSHRVQIYVDDPAVAVGGSKSARSWALGRTLILWAALGARIALHKVSRGKAVKWIGATYSVVPGGIEVAVDQERIARLTQVVQAGLQEKGLIAKAQSLAGELSWIAGIVPTVRPFVNMIWAAVYSLDDHSKKVQGGEASGRTRPQGSALANMVKLPLTWFLKFLQGEHGGLKRRRLLRDRWATPQWTVRTDASTTGCGGMLIDQLGNIVRWYAAAFTPEMLKPLGIPAGEPGRMTAYELLALLVALRTWQPYLRKCRIGVLVQLDSESALRVVSKLASSEPVVNRLAAEISLLIEQGGMEAVEGQHWRNIINIEADALSRLEEGYEVPERLRDLPRDRAPDPKQLYQVF